MPDPLAVSLLLALPLAGFISTALTGRLLGRRGLSPCPCSRSPGLAAR